MATVNEIKSNAQLVKDATEIGENTASRVGGVLVDMAGHLPETIEQKTGTSTTSVMSQKAVTDELAKKANQTDVEDALAGKVDNADIVQELGDSENAVMSQKAVTDAILNKIDLSAIDFDSGTLVKLAMCQAPTRFNVVKNNKSCGTMEVFSDDMGHMVTEVFDTHYTLVDGELGTEHLDDKIFTYFRSYHISGGTSNISVGTWGEWKQVYASDNNDRLTEVEASSENLSKNVGLDEYENFSDQKAYSAGDTVKYNGLLYTFTADHAAGAFDEGKVEETNIKSILDKKYLQIKESVHRFNNTKSLYDYIISANITSNNTWGNVGNNLMYGVIIPIEAGEHYGLLMTDELKRYAWLKDNSYKANSTPNYVDNEDSYIHFSGNTIQSIVAPNDAKYLYLSCSTSGKVVMPYLFGKEFYDERVNNFNLIIISNKAPTLINDVLNFGDEESTLRIVSDEGIIYTYNINGGFTVNITSGQMLYFSLSELTFKTFTQEQEGKDGLFILLNFRGYLCNNISDRVIFEKLDSYKSEFSNKIESLKSDITKQLEKKAVSNNGYIIAGNISSSGTWANVQSGLCYSKIIPIKNRYYFTLSTYNPFRRIAFLKSVGNISDGKRADFCDGEDGYRTYSNGDKILPPIDCNFIVLYASDLNAYIYDINLFEDEESQFKKIGVKYREFAGNISSLGTYVNPDGTTINSILFKVKKNHKYILFSNITGLKKYVLLKNADFTNLQKSDIIQQNDSYIIDFNDGDVVTPPVGCNFISIFITTSADSYANRYYPYIVDIDDATHDLSNRKTLNKGKKIAVFGGSYSSIDSSMVAKNIWKKVLQTDVVDTWGIEGSGFGINTHHKSESAIESTAKYSKTKWSWTDDSGVLHTGEISVQGQVEQACAKAVEPYDIYVLWASTNDFTTYPCDVGTRDSYTDSDGYNEDARNTQCGGINYCIKKILEKNPNAIIVLFGSLRFFSMRFGYDSQSSHVNEFSKKYIDYINGQKECCERFNIPYLSQWDMMDINEYNYTKFYKSDNMHMNNLGYERAGYKQAEFLLNAISNL